MNQGKIPEHLYGYFERSGSRKRYWPGETIYMQGDAANRLYVVREGRVRAFYTTGSGKELTFEIIEKGRMFGESSLISQCPRPVSVAAVNQVELYACDWNRLYECMEENGELMGIMFRLLSDTCNHLTEQLRRITLYDRHQKIAGFLLEETGRPDLDRGVTPCSIPYTQEDLAMVLGLNRVTVNRVLGEWREAGIISTSYSEIKILDRERLKALLPPGVV